MSRRDGACWRHPAQRASGVCADCLKERLSALSPSSEIPQRSSFEGTKALATSGLEQKQKTQQQTVLSPLLSDAYLRRSKSWSHWEGGGGLINRQQQQNQLQNNQWNINKHAARKSDAVLDDWTRQRFFSIFARDQQQHKNGTFHHNNRIGTPFRGLESNRNNVTNQAQNVVDGNVVVVGSTVVDSSVNLQETGNGDVAGLKKARLRKPAWLHSLLQFALGKKHKEARKEATNNIKTGTSREYPKVQVDSWPRSPLRIFKQEVDTRKNQRGKNSKKNLTVVNGGVDDVRRNSCSEEQQQRNSWSIPSSTEMKKLHHHHPTPAYTTAYYRDYGGISLSNSPVPNGRWSSQRSNKQVQDHCSSSSPYHHRVASPSMWNFYLTPLRTSKATSKHHNKY